MKCLRFLIVFGILIISNNKGKAQASLKDSSINVVLTALHYGAYVPAGNLDKRFGFSNDVGLSVTNKFASNWLLGIEGSFLFGNEVKETSLFVDISNQDGGIIGSDGKYADVKTFERGFMIVMNAGKLYQFKKPNANSGLVFMAGAGLMQHKIRIEVSGNTVPYLDKE